MLQDKLDVMIILVVVMSLVPAVFEWWRHRRERTPTAAELEESTPTPEEMETGSRDQV